MYIFLIQLYVYWITNMYFRYLRSLVETILIYQHFKKPCVEQPAPKLEVMDFWMDFLVEATKKDVSSVRFPVSAARQSLDPSQSFKWGKKKKAHSESNVLQN